MAAAANRDVRIDTIGFVGLLKRQVESDLRTAVKVRMDTDELATVAGDYFTGSLVATVSRSLPPAAWLRLYERKQITRAEYLSACSVGFTEATKILGAHKANALSVSKPGQRLDVDAIEGIKPSLLQAVVNLCRETRKRTPRVRREQRH